MQEGYIENIKKEFSNYKVIGEKAIALIPDDKLFWQFNSESNSVGIIVTHLSGNMQSRWTDFLTSDGEKDWRNRDTEFENKVCDRIALMHMWKTGWDCLFVALNGLNIEDLNKFISIRNQSHTVYEAINRQLAHYPYHIGQIVQLGKMTSENWLSLSIPKGESVQYNSNIFSKAKP
ncbi:DUF1572 family protein [uncultured Cytophaga sp.]|uniref:DUF1572 family protein n=1 Tax=uncultured Cytophaga sp. TaxID=160238 RepID=UPI0026153095|nr:DUF1572 family protein [uncultured Cytophaga sp.]